MGVKGDTVLVALVPSPTSHGQAFGQPRRVALTLSAKVWPSGWELQQVGFKQRNFTNRLKANIELDHSQRSVCLGVPPKAICQ
jgi:hypothetical protein